MGSKLLLALLFSAAALAQNFHTYIGSLDQSSATIAWGTTRGGGNTIGRDSESHGHATVRVGGREHPTERNWIRITGLQPDTDYDYEVHIDGRPVGAGTFRTWPASPRKLAFFVVGGYGNDKGDQHKIALAMWREFLRRSQTDNPIRFVMTTGDNIYGWGIWPVLLGSGDRDAHWRDRFFNPYEEILRRVPFYPTLGDYDCAQAESRGDLEVYLDNFFFPDNRPAQYYRFSYGELAEFFALDSTNCRISGDETPNYPDSSEQTHWLRSSLSASKAIWKIPYFHHPPFTAGPEYAPALEDLRHWVQLFQTSGVQVAFTGHENNFQVSERNSATGNVVYVVSSAGSELRDNNIASRLKGAGMALFANQRHFLTVELQEDTMRIWPMADRPVQVRGSDAKARPLPISISVK